MPTILRLRAFNIVINTRNEHGPAHVHCVGPGVVVEIYIESGAVKKNNGVHSSDVAKLQKLISENAELLMNEWRHYHGNK